MKLLRANDVAAKLGLKVSSVYVALQRNARSVPVPDYRACPTCGTKIPLWEEKGRLK